MRYDSFQYLWPPRPEKAIPRALISGFESRGWVASCKMNGTCSLLAISPEKKIVAMSRHNDTHKLWSPTEESSTPLIEKTKGRDGWFVFVSELMHSKVPGIRDTNYIHDILVNDGEYLVGTSFTERQQTLRDIFMEGSVTEAPTHYVIANKLWLAKNVQSGLVAFYDSMSKPEHEGIVLKRPNAKLLLCSGASTNSDWQVKSRRAHKNFSF